MWVQFFTKPTTDMSFTLEKYQVDGEDLVALPESVSTPDTVRFIAEKAKMSEKDIADKGMIRVNMKMVDFQERVSGKVADDTHRLTVAPPAHGSVEGMMYQLITLQQQQAQQQQEFLRIIAGSMAPQPRFELVKPEVFDGTNASPQGWLHFYDYACEKNYWHTDEDKIKNMRLFLEKMAKSWYELRIVEHSGDTWKSWKESFLTSFQLNAVDRWQHALSFRYKSGSTLEYFFEKRRLLQIADPNLPDTSVVPLVVLGMSNDLQRQVQIKNPANIEDLLRCCGELCIERAPADERSPRTVQEVTRFGSQTTWRRRGQESTTLPGRQFRPPENQLHHVDEVNTQEQRVFRADEETKNE